MSFKDGLIFRPHAAPCLQGFSFSFLDKVRTADSDLRETAGIAWKSTGLSLVLSLSLEIKILRYASLNGPAYRF